MSMIATMMYTMMTSIDQMQSLFAAQSERQILDVAEAVAINKLKPIGHNQALISEVGSKGEYYQEIPSEWGIQTVNSYGNKLIYCPIGQAISGPIGLLESDTVKTSNEDEYQVRLKSSFNGKRYVVESGFEQDHSYENKAVIAFIISPQSSTGISCSSVYLETSGDYEKFKINASHGKGRVAAITRDLVMSYKANQPIVIKSSENESADLKSLTDYWQSIHPLRFSVLISNSEEIDLGGSDISMINQFPGSNQEVMIKGEGGIRTINSAAYRSIVFENVSVVLENINLTGQIKLSFINSDVVMKGVSLQGEVVAINSKISFDNIVVKNGVKIINSNVSSHGNNEFEKSSNHAWSESTGALELVNSNYSEFGSSQIQSRVFGLISLLANNAKISLNNSSMFITASENSPGAIMLTNGSELTTSSSNVSLIANDSSANSLIGIDESSRINSLSSLYRTLGSTPIVFNSHGDMSFVGSEVRTDSSVGKIISINGLSKLNLSRNTTIGSGSGGSIGISSENGNQIGGSDAHIYANVCLDGDVDNKANWQCN